MCGCDTQGPNTIPGTGAQINNKFIRGCAVMSRTLEFILSIGAVVWGVWNIQPVIPVETYVFARMGATDISVTVSLISIVLGSLTLYTILRIGGKNGVEIRKNTAMALCSFWSVILFLHVKYEYYTPATVVYPLFIIGEAWVFWATAPRTHTDS